MGTQYEHGLDFSEFDGDWPMPETGTGVLKIFDEDNHQRILVLDFTDGCFYDISLRDGPINSTVQNGFKDKIETNGTGGTSISPSVLFKEDTGEYERFLTEHYSSHFYVRPYKESNRSASGYDANGYISGAVFNSSIYVDGEPTTVTSLAEDVNIFGEVVYDKKAEGRRLQTKFSATESGFRLVGRQQEYITKDVIYHPDDRITTEDTSQFNITDDLEYWYTRGSNPIQCKVTNNVLASTGTLTSRTTGPDGKSNSAVSFTGTVTIISTPPSTTMSILFWTSTGGATMSVGGTPVSLTTVTTYNGWTLYRYTGNINGSVTMVGTGSPTSLFDLRIYSGTKTNFTYYYNDVINNSADNVCPLF